MDDIMILMHRLIVDVQGFDETHFGIFNEHELKDLVMLWELFAHKNPNKFISMLSPDQKMKLVSWAIERTEYNVSDMIIGLEKFLKVLKKMPNKTYPKPIVEKKTRKSIFKKN